MRRGSIRIPEAESRTALLPRLRGRAFHVTCGAHLDEIVQGAAILPNGDGALRTTFGSSANSYFRNRGCVSVFDYRSIGDDDLKQAIMNCSPWQAADHCAFTLAFLFLGERACAQLLSWTDWKSSQAYGEMVVPHAEAGHPGPITIDSLDEILEVTFDRGPEHPFVAALRMPRPPRR